jgi:sensor histidine kinase regulating citrate/malate metabolism
MKRMLNINKTIAAIIISNLIHLVVVIGLLVYALFYDLEKRTVPNLNNTSLIFFIIIFLSIFINSFFAVKNALVLNNTNNQHKMLKSTLKYVENLNKTLRAQRHDFMNHLQVVYSLIEMEEYVDASDYIEQIYNDIQKVNKVLKTSIPAINALLQAKLLHCEQKEITVELSVTSILEGINLPSWELCRVFGNIIDNAVYVLERFNGEKLINISIFEDIKSYGIVIENNGPDIPKNIINKVFEAGFTTKGSEGEGMGLSISKNIIERYGGIITVKSANNSTRFNMYIPKQNDNTLKTTT